ncbi:hypothetical protein [Acanthopleuribacter pedis]|uniref:Uncharacterized protein n=1 Tax=Acanthopleuribacter pedis TaxID=442870 RepID=A0A8J7QF73_9BACT|nr:hypothetical protein [Acanthopleuribacter pedis]MBO1323199.1 hypothetical protein [Acanthopleuribacter pedis]
MSSLFSQADDIFFSRHPELVNPSTGERRLLTMNPSDTALRQEWMTIYRALEDAENGGYEVCDIDGVVQPCPKSDSGLPKKYISSNAKKRLDIAQEAINYAKNIFSFGAGNQSPALTDTNFNSYYRMSTSRDNSMFNITEEVVDIATENPMAFLAAKAELTKGGNCGEHAHVVYDYIRRNYPEVKVQIAQKKELDHAFVIIGDHSTETHTELVVADAWPTDPTPVLWEDHFAYAKNEDTIIHAEAENDDRDYRKELFEAGLSLNEKGTKRTETSLSEDQTKDKVDSGNGWIWNHSDTASQKFEYLVDPELDVSPPSIGPLPPPEEPSTE